MKIALAVISAFAAGVVVALLLHSSPAVSQERDSYEYRVTVESHELAVADLNRLGSLGYRVVHMAGPDRDNMLFLLEKKK